MTTETRLGLDYTLSLPYNPWDEEYNAEPVPAVAPALCPRCRRALTYTEETQLGRCADSADCRAWRNRQ